MWQYQYIFALEYTEQVQEDKHLLCEIAYSGQY